MSRSWRVSAFVAACGVVAAVVQLLAGAPVGAAASFVILAGFAAVLSPLPFPRAVPAAEAATRSAADGRPIVYWRPGCPFCLRLRANLGRDAGSMHWVNIWSDPDGAAAVREITGGDETVPTVVTADDARVNPDPSWVRAQLTRT